MVAAADYYGSDWDTWQRDCFVALFKKMDKDPEKYAIVLGEFMLPKPKALPCDKERLKLGYEFFLGVASGTSKKRKADEAFPKIDPRRVKFIIPEYADSRRQGDPAQFFLDVTDYTLLCCECLQKIASDLQLQVCKSISEAVNAI